jgi:murein L,D-transpeptidase YafK
MGPSGTAKGFRVRRTAIFGSMVMGGRVFVVLFLLVITLCSSDGDAKSIVEICVERGIYPFRASIVVVKAKRKLFFYLNGKFVKAYPVVFGKNPHGQKLYEGDNCTPEGVFRVVCTWVHEKWSRFILLNYPTWDDVRRHHKACSEGLIPLKEGICIGLGGGIGIHGTYSEALNRSQIDWTEGCVSLVNRDIEEFFPYLEEGDLVFILP